MSEITFPQRHAKSPDGADIIEFPAVVDGETISCRITLEELNREFLNRTSPKTFEEHFLMLRPQVEERARRLILAKRGEGQ